MAEREYKFQKLTPIQNADIGIYSEALDYVFENNDLRNIAISGAYSAGKSSVLESYKASHLDKKFLHISLAHFRSEEEYPNTMDETQEDMSESETIDESILEGKILNQLIHQIPPSCIPQTNFRVKQKVSSRKIILWVIATIIFVLSFLHVLFFNSWKNYVGDISVIWINNILSFTTRNSFPLVSGGASVVLAAMLMYSIYKTQANKGIFKRVSADKFEIEIFEGSDDSYFDKYLNEVLYLFDQCGADVIVFEDMDRYNASRIFERLREVNTLINVQRNKSENIKPLRFFYLLRDDIFTSKDRTKFFDFIIPVVPVVDGSNSYDQFIKHLSDSGVLELFDEPFLQGLSLYIDDMRILKNICNEFTIYDSRLNITELNPNKLMAIIAYKNIFPRDFSELQLGKGFVFTLFDKKDQFIVERIVQLQSDLVVAKEKFEAMKKEHLTSEEELNLVIENKRENVRNSRAYYYHNEKQQQYALIEDEKKMRKEAIDALNNGRLPAVKANIQHIEKVIAKTKNETLQDIITRENIDEIFAVTSKNDIGAVLDFKEIRGNDYFALLKYLIRNGYIDESYADYMTYFYEHSLSRADKIFLRSVSDQIRKEYGYQLKEPAKIFARLDASVFEQPEVLNYDLFFYLMKKCAIRETTIQYPANVPSFYNLESPKTKEQQCLLVMVEQILSTNVYSFIQSAFIDIQGEKINYFVNLLNAMRKDCLTNILQNKVEFAGNSCDEFILRTLIVTPDRDITGNDDLRSALTNFISNHSRLFDRDCIEETKLKTLFGKDIMQKLIRVSLIERFKLLQVRFCSINYEVADRKLFDAIYSNNLYTLSFPNIVQMLKIKYELSESDDFKHKNYTLIRKQTDSSLFAYVESEIDLYITEVLANCDEKIEDDDEVVVILLNNSKVSVKQKVAYIDVLKTVIRLLSSLVDKTLWQNLIQLNLVEHTETNVLDYFIQYGNDFTEELIDFINRDKHIYNFEDCFERYDEENKRAFFNAVVRCDELSDIHYEEFITTMGWHYNNGFSMKNITYNKMNLLIENKVIHMSETNLSFIREEYQSHLIHYIVRNIEQYCDLFDTDDLFDADEATELIAENIPDEFKIRLLRNISCVLSAINVAYSDEVKATILTNNFNINDLPHFVTKYSLEGKKTKAAIILRAKDWIAKSSTEELPISRQLFDDVISSDSNISLNHKTTLLSYLLPSLDEKQCKDYLSQLKLDNFLSLFEQKRPKILINDSNERILEIFQRNHWITKFEVDEKDNGYYRAYGRKIHLNNREEDIVLL